MFIKDKTKLANAYFAGGCFWGTEHYLQQAPGVINTTVGYMGGKGKDPTYEQVLTHSTGHAETVKVEFDPTQTSFEEIAKLFFEIHDPGQVDKQGPDVGPQYRSAIFYTNPDQKKIALKLIKILKDKGYKVVTKLEKAKKFWPAEDYHQKYYQKNGQTPYCHVRIKKF